MKVQTEIDYRDCLTLTVRSITAPPRYTDAVIKPIRQHGAVRHVMTVGVGL